MVYGPSANVEIDSLYPARTIESDTVLMRSDKRAVVTKNICYGESDHHGLEAYGNLHPCQYPR